MNLNNTSTRLRRELLVKIITLQLDGKLEEGVDRVPYELFPRDKPSVRCCIFHDRAIVKYRIMARLGYSIEDETDEAKPLASYAKEALNRERVAGPILTVLDEACNSCVKTQYFVTNACQGCLARPCENNCPRGAVSIGNGVAGIDKSKCVNCGICLQVCPYHAIIKMPVPCEEACPVGAIAKDERGKEKIDYSKCIFCGRCMSECPFGAMLEKSQIVDVLKSMADGKRVVALFAPAVAAQFPVAVERLEAAMRAAGFSRTYEVALGADITAEKEAREFVERMERGDKLMTTSCCPSYIEAVRKHLPELKPFVSETRSPMHYTAELARTDDPEAVTVFIGPCLAKRKEGLDDSLVDFVISAEELGTLFVAKGIEVADCEAAPQGKAATSTGRGFAATGGVARAVEANLPLSLPSGSLKAETIDGLSKKNIQLLKIHAQGKGQANLLEVMACEGGCIAGPCVITNSKVAAGQLKSYVEEREA
jgi:[FeFe] hydrogenase (group B1/B3)